MSRIKGIVDGGGDGFLNTSLVLVDHGHSLIIKLLQEVDQEILPCGQRRIDSVKINPSLLMMRECCTLTEKVLLQSPKGVGLWNIPMNLSSQFHLWSSRLWMLEECYF